MTGRAAPARASIRSATPFPAPPPLDPHEDPGKSQVRLSPPGRGGVSPMPRSLPFTRVRTRTQVASLGSASLSDPSRAGPSPSSSSPKATMVTRKDEGDRVTGATRVCAGSGLVSGRSKWVRSLWAAESISLPVPQREAPTLPPVRSSVRHVPVGQSGPREGVWLPTGSHRGPVFSRETRTLSPAPQSPLAAAFWRRRS